MSGSENGRDGSRRGAGADRNKSNGRPSKGRQYSDRKSRFGENDKRRSGQHGKNRRNESSAERGAGKPQDRKGDFRRGQRYGRAGEKKFSPRGEWSRKGEKPPFRKKKHSAKPVPENADKAVKKNREPQLPDGISPSELDAEIWRELRPLPKGVADNVAAHLVAAGHLIDEEPQRALEHARYARERAPRIPSVREAVGLAAYLSGEWSEALSELRAARRLAGGPGHLALMADCERALGRPERALDISRSQEATQLSEEEAVELKIVAAGARRDLGELEAAVVSLQGPALDVKRQEPWSARLFYAYADNLLAAGRVREAFTWFLHAAHADDDAMTDAAERLDELTEQLGGPEAVESLVSEVEQAGAD